MKFFVPAAAAQPTADDADLARLALGNLRAVVVHNRQLPRFHAAEDLVLLGEPDPLAVIASALPAAATQPVYRIIYWRVRAREDAAAGRSMEKWTRAVTGIFLAVPPAPDRVNAAETLGKLGFYPGPGERSGFETVAREESEAGVEARWVLANGGGAAEERALAALLRSGKESFRLGAAYALRFLPRLRPATRRQLLAAAEAEPGASSARAYLFSAAFVHASPAERPRLLRVVEDYVDRGSADDRYECMNALALAGGREELPRLRRYLRPPEPYTDANADLRVGSGNAILQILRR